MIAVWLLLVHSSYANGSANWEWKSKEYDFIVRGTITHGNTPDIEIKYFYEGNPLIAYYTKGTLRIESVLYLNPDNRYPDSYKYVLRHLKDEHAVMLPGYRAYFDCDWGSKGDEEIRIRPDPKIPEEETIYVLNFDYVFPIGGLVLQSIVPLEDEPKLIEILQVRTCADKAPKGKEDH